MRAQRASLILPVVPHPTEAPAHLGIDRLPPGVPGAPFH